MTCYNMEEFDGTLKDVYDGIERLKFILKTSTSRDNLKVQIKNFRKKWLTLMKQFFRLRFNESIYDSFSDEIMKSLIEIRGYIAIDALYGLTISSIVCPIISIIMDDDKEPSKEQKEQQVLRANFLLRLLQYNMISVNGDEAEEFETEEETGTQRGTGQSRTQQTQSQQTTNRSQVFNLLTAESVFILENLFDAIKIFSEGATKEGFDIQQSIYHIMNISYITRIIQLHLDEIQKHIQLSGLRKSSGLDSLKSLVPNYQEIVMSCLDMVDLNNPLTIFRSSLKGLSIKLKILSSFIN